MQRQNQPGFLACEDISQTDFDPARYGLNRKEVMGVMHAARSDGRIITQAEVFRHTYRHLDLDWIFIPVGWPEIRIPVK